MFDLANDRLNYTELLEPREGYELDFAVGMTYSLDLEALLSVPVALGLIGENDEGLMENPFYVLEGIRKSSDKLAIFCNAGCIHLPSKILSVFSLLENSVFEVKLDNKKNFHPKLWFIKYNDSKQNSYIKLIISSRNLTFDKSIDLCVVLEGEVKKEVVNHNRELVDLLKFTEKFIDTKNALKKQKLFELISALQQVDTFQVDEPFESCEFLPFGLDTESKDKCGLFDKKDSIFIVSPFLSDSIIEQLIKDAKNKTLITRKSSITKKIFDSFYSESNDGVYVTKDVLTDNEYGLKQDVHAKLYFCNTDSGNYLYIGSSNASYNAFHNNIEFLIKLKYRKYTMSYNKLMQDFIPDTFSPFEKVSHIPEQDSIDEDKKVDQLFKDVIYAIKSATIECSGDTYSIHLFADVLNSVEKIEIAPLQKKNQKQIFTTFVCFDGLLLKELSQFYVVSACGKSIVVKVETLNFPLQERDDMIFKSIIDTKDKFLIYISYMLSDDYLLDMGLSQNVVMHFDETQKMSPFSFDGLYEKMLEIAHKNPTKLREISQVISRLDEKVISKEFSVMYACFETAIERKK